MTFKDLKKKITSSSNQQQTQSFDILQDKPFWIWESLPHYAVSSSVLEPELAFYHISCCRQDSWVVKPLTRVAFEGMMRLTEKIA
jgi:hypothetical protein